MTVLRGAADAAKAAAAVVSDPALPTVIKLINELHSLEKKGAPTTGAKPGGSYSAGVGLSAAVAPLQAAIYLKKNPHVLMLGSMALFAVPLLLGFSLGRSSKR